MIDVVSVKFRNAGKIYYFDPAGADISEGDGVIVETARGVEFGIAASGNHQVQEKEIVQPLKPIIRKATDEDIEAFRENNRKKEKAKALCQEKVNKHGLDMKLIDVEYTFDNNKIIFYFTSDGRVDFRELVKDLASVFRMRIELRQIGVRDEAKMLGGVGNCGRELCCSQWLSEFQSVSIKMAKLQNLSLNPTKISGVCGRLMCCLKYENDVYAEMKKGLPAVGEKIKTPDGIARVTDTVILEGSVRCRIILQEAEGDEEEKLDADILTYNKKEIKRLERRKKEKREEQDEEITDEIRKLLDD